MALILLFIDGMGIGSQIENPLTASAVGPLKFSRETLKDYSYCGGVIKGVDANLGLEGLPQSATGQTAIFSGANAAQAIGRHLSGMPTRSLRELLRKNSIFKKVKAMGLKATFANAFSPAYFLFPLKRISASTLHMLYAGIQPHWLWQISHGKALYQDFTNISLKRMGFNLPRVSPHKAGKILAEFLKEYDFTLYEYFQTDIAGHGRTARSPFTIIRQLDAMITALLDNTDLSKNTVAICSDHGNIEDLSTRSHTRNPVPLLAWGKNAEILLDGVESISEICKGIDNFFRDN